MKRKTSLIKKELAELPAWFKNPSGRDENGKVIRTANGGTLNQDRALLELWRRILAQKGVPLLKAINIVDKSLGPEPNKETENIILALDKLEGGNLTAKIEITMDMVWWFELRKAAAIQNVTMGCILAQLCEGNTILDMSNERTLYPVIVRPKKQKAAR